MEDPSNQPNFKQRYIVIGAIVVFLMVIITMSILISTFSNHEEARVVNESGLSTAENTLISDEDMTRFKKELYGLLNNTQSADHDFDAAVRWNTVKTTSGTYPSTTFLVDVDEYRQTYRVTIDQYTVNINCPNINESKYPSSFCIGNGAEGDDSTTIVFGDMLPYSGETSEGELFSLQRPSSGGISYTRSPNLNLYVYACSDFEAAKERARDSVEEYITSLGAPTDLFNLQIKSGGGCHNQ